MVLRPFLVGDKVQNTKFEFFFLVIFGATLSRRFAIQIFTSFLSRKDLTKLFKQKNGFLFFVLFPTRYDRARQSQQKLQFCTLFLYSHKECTNTGNYVPSGVRNMNRCQIIESTHGRSKYSMSKTQKALLTFALD